MLKLIPSSDKKGMSSWRSVFVLQEDGTINPPPDVHVWCIECISWTRNLWDLLFIRYTANSRDNLRIESIVDISPFKFECYLESLIWAAAFSDVIRLLSFLILSDFLFCSPPSSHSSAARAPYKPAPGFFLGFCKASCVHFHHICCLMLRLSSCKLLKIPYSAMRTKTSKCWTIVSLFEAAPQAGLIACCSLPFSPPSSPPLSFSLLHRSHYFPRIAACCCNLWHNSLRRNLELRLNYRLFALMFQILSWT